MITILLLLLLLYLILKTNVNKEIVLFLIALYFLNYLKNNYFKRDLIEGLDMESAADFVGLGDEYAAATAATASTWCPPKHMASLAMDWRQTIPGATTQCNFLRYQFDENWFKGDYDDGDDNEVCRPFINTSCGDCDDCTLTDDTDDVGAGLCQPNWLRHLKEGITSCSNFKDSASCLDYKEVEEDGVGCNDPTTKVPICDWITVEGDTGESCVYKFGQSKFDKECTDSLIPPDCALSSDETSCSHPLCEWIPPTAATAATATEPAVAAVPGVCSDRSLEPLVEINGMKNICESHPLPQIGDSTNICQYRLGCDDGIEEHKCEYQTNVSKYYPDKYDDTATVSPCADDPVDPADPADPTQ